MMTEQLPQTPDTTVSLPQTPPENALPEKESGGRKEGLEATRYGTWEKNGRDVDF